jgi:hypothetical protein
MIAAAARAAWTLGYAIPLRRASAVFGGKPCSVGNGWMAGAVAALKEFGPYAAIELVLPGGSLIAVLLWLHRRRKVRRNPPEMADGLDNLSQV